MDKARRLLEYDENRMGPPKGQLPLMAVVQHNKNKVRPVLDWIETNRFIEAFTRNSDVCAEKLRQWRRMGTSPAIIDLREAYLQLKAGETLWPYQHLCLRANGIVETRLNSGFNVSPIIMVSVVSAIVERWQSEKRDIDKRR